MTSIIHPTSSTSLDSDIASRQTKYGVPFTRSEEEFYTRPALLKEYVNTIFPSKTPIHSKTPIMQANPSTPHTTSPVYERIKVPTPVQYQRRISNFTVIAPSHTHTPLPTEEETISPPSRAYIAISYTIPILIVACFISLFFFPWFQLATESGSTSYYFYNNYMWVYMISSFLSVASMFVRLMTYRSGKRVCTAAWQIILVNFSIVSLIPFIVVGAAQVTGGQVADWDIGASLAVVMHILVIAGSLIFAYTMSKAAASHETNITLPTGYDNDDDDINNPTTIDMVELHPESRVVAGSGAQ